jgi:hypothetical protein
MIVARSISRTYLLLLAAGAAVAAITAVTAAAGARRFLGFTFTGTHPSLAVAMSTFVNNARLACVPLVFALALCSAESCSPSLAGRRWSRACRWAMDTVILVGVTLNVVLIGASVGAYGARMVAALLPHGPLEALAFATALGAYVTARGGHTNWRNVLLAGAGSMITLATAAVLETYG